MSFRYGTTKSPLKLDKNASPSGDGFFTDSQFLVFLNRWSALLLSGVLLWLTRADRTGRSESGSHSHRSSPSNSGAVSNSGAAPDALPRVIEPPFALYLYSSLANIVSSWMQYEALKYVSFPTQACAPPELCFLGASLRKICLKYWILLFEIRSATTTSTCTVHDSGAQVIAKSAKLLSTMLLGRCVARRRFSAFEWSTAMFISAGACLFFVGIEVGGSGSAAASSRRLSARHAKAPLPLPQKPVARSNADADTEWESLAGLASGVAILVSYLVADSFTSNWQERLFKEYRVSCLHMMFGVNVYSTLLTCVSLAASGGFASALAFAAQHPAFVLDALLVSLSSAVGQLVIFYTIVSFGAATFALVMTV